MAGEMLRAVLRDHLAGSCRTSAGCRTGHIPRNDAADEHGRAEQKKARFVGNGVVMSPLHSLNPPFFACPHYTRTYVRFQ